MLRRLAFTAYCLIGLAALTSASRADTLRIGGTGSALGDMARLADAYMRTRSGIAIAVLPSLGGTGGLKALQAGAIDIALHTKPLSPEHVAAGLVATPYAKTALVFAASAEVAVDGVSTDWIVKVYRGTTTQWPDGRAIRLVLRPAHDSDMKLLSAVSREMKEATVTALGRPGLLIEDTAQGAARKIAGLPGAFGTSTLAQTGSERIALQLLALDGVAPSLDTLATGRYPLVKEFFHIVRPDASAAARDFIDFIKTDDAAAILAATGNVVVRARKD